MTEVTSAHVPSRVVLNQADIDRALTRIAHEILEANKGSKDLVLLGIPSRGYPLAVRLANKIAAADPHSERRDDGRPAGCHHVP